LNIVGLNHYPPTLGCGGTTGPYYFDGIKLHYNDLYLFVKGNGYCNGLYFAGANLQWVQNVITPNTGIQKTGGNIISKSSDPSNYYVYIRFSSLAAGAESYVLTGSTMYSRLVSKLLADVATSHNGVDAYVTIGSSNDPGYDRAVYQMNADLSTVKSVVSTSNPLSTDVEVSNDDKFVYINEDGLLYVFSRNLTNGNLTEIGATGYSPSGSMIISKDDKNIYTTGGNIYSRYISTGGLNSIGTYPSPDAGSTSNPGRVVISHDNKSLYAINGNYIYQYDRVMTDGGTGDFLSYIGNLPSNTRIYFRGYAVNGNGTGYSSDGTFVTNP
jgi:hypothetical protein